MRPSPYKPKRRRARGFGRKIAWGMIPMRIMGARYRERAKKGKHRL